MVCDEYYRSERLDWFFVLQGAYGRENALEGAVMTQPISQAEKELAAIVDFLDNKRIAAKHDWESLPIANRVVTLAPQAAADERQRIIALLTKVST